MIYNLRNTIYLFFVVLTVGACSQQYEPTPIVKSGEVDGYLAISVNLPNLPIVSRAGAGSVGAANNDDVYTGSLIEQRVRSARVVLYDSNKMVTYSFDIMNTDIAVGSFASTAFTIKAKKLKKDVYDVLVLLNPTTEVKEITNVGSVKSQFEAVAIADINKLTSINNGIFMCNANGYVSTTDSNWKQTQEEAEAANVSLKVRVERSVAKVFVSPRSGSSILAIGAINGTAIMMDWGLDIMNKKIYWMRKPNLSLSGNGTSISEAPTMLESITTPAFYQYSVDPNMGAFVQKSSDFWYYNEDNAFRTSEGGWEDEKGLYVTENTMDAVAQRGLSTTRALIKAQYLPNALQDLASSADKTWADYKGKLMTLVELNAKIIASETAVDDKAIEMPTGFKSDMQRLKEAGQTFMTTTPSFYKNNLKFYHNGENYYTTLIRHFDDTKQPMKMAYGRYGVVRNHIYKIEITKILGPGTPTPPEPEDIPNDKDKTYISVSVNVLPWSVRKQDVTVLE